MLKPNTGAGYIHKHCDYYDKPADIYPNNSDDNRVSYRDRRTYGANTNTGSARNVDSDSNSPNS